MVEPLLSEEPEFLKIYSYLKFDNCCLFAYRYLFGKYGHGVILLKLKNSAYLFEIYKLFMILIHGQAKFGIFYPKVTADVFPIELDRSVMSFEKWGESMFFGKESIPCILDPQDGSVKKLYADDTQIVIFQEDKLSRSPINKDFIYKI